MKNIFLLSLAIAFGVSQAAWSQNVGINATGASPNTSAMLDIASSNKGLLIPRVALSSSNVATPITSPEQSLLVYNTATAGTAPDDVVPGYYYWNGTSWVRLLTSYASSSGSDWSIAGNAGTDAETDFIGTTDDADFVFKTNNQETLRILSGGGIESNAGIGDGSLPASAFYATGTYNNYLEINVQNLSNGNLASSDIVATANNGSGSSVYVDLGINSQGYSNGASNILSGGNLAYLYANADHFKIGNGTPNKALIFFTNPSGGALGTNTANGVERMRIAPDGSVGINNNTPISTLDNNGSLGLSIVRTSASITLDATHYTVMLHSGTPSVTLPSASSNARRIYVIVNQTAAPRTISTYKDFVLNNVTTIAASSSITIQSDGTNWYQIR
jgi:hypothetical protein